MREARKGYAAARDRARDSINKIDLYEIWLRHDKNVSALSGRCVRHAHDYMGGAARTRKLTFNTEFESL